MPKFKIILSLVILLSCPFYGSGHTSVLKKSGSRTFNSSTCDNVKGFTQELKAEIHSKANDVNRIINLVLIGNERHSTYNELALFCDTFGPRLSGSDSLRNAIQHMEKKMRDDSKLKTSKEKAMIPKWEVNDQWAEMVEPVRHRMSILALGMSLGTNNRTLEAEAVVVRSFDELNRLGASGQISGKIVVYNYVFTSYGESVQFRTQGASRAQKYGAIAALVRSVTPFSIYSPHTGTGSRSIPTAAITLEDADLIQRWANRNKRIVLRVYIDANYFGEVESFNLIGEIPGKEKADEVVLVSGHIDTWYNTQGAMDDGGGMMISYKALDVLNKLNLQAKRTLRAILWTSEEFGLIGVQQYFKDHKHELNKFKIVMESDLGTFEPLGLSFTNMNPLSQCIVSEVLQLLKPIGTTTLDTNYEGSDIEMFTDAGVPGLSLLNDNKRYFYYHHTSGDAITVEDPDHLDKSTILWAAASYVLADLSVDISNTHELEDNRLSNSTTPSETSNSHRHANNLVQPAS